MTLSEPGADSEVILYYAGVNQMRRTEMNLSDMNKGAYFINFLSETIDSNERFGNFIKRYDTMGELLGIPDQLRLGFLNTDGKNKIGVQMLPDRLMSAVKTSRETGKNYADSKTHIQPR